MRRKWVRCAVQMNRAYFSERLDAKYANIKPRSKPVMILQKLEYKKSTSIVNDRYCVVELDSWPMPELD